jgi:hypothetical protein
VSKHGTRVLVWVPLKEAGCGQRQEPRNAGVAGKSRESEAALLLGGRPRPTPTKPALQFVVKRKPAKFR